MDEVPDKIQLWGRHIVSLSAGLAKEGDSEHETTNNRGRRLPSRGKSLSPYPDDGFWVTRK